MRKALVTALLVLPLAAACTTTERNTSIGAATGAAIGGIATNSWGGAAIGGLAGGAVGAAVSR
ncbi:YMGG-like glycine zipper-containing protein [Martelella sp. HB161492]|uniref:YMGG-like glycine zipper-containing protein n=1 Tax=Martelella sp. HB161492 TaxID=2720726 RepID=UPI00158FDB3E|nr:YMGG-like glycine zipper-containing protein [Martelella sp. HB161492]